MDAWQVAVAVIGLVIVVTVRGTRLLDGTVIGSVIAGIRSWMVAWAAGFTLTSGLLYWALVALWPDLGTGWMHGAIDHLVSRPRGRPAVVVSAIIGLAAAVALLVPLLAWAVESLIRRGSHRRRPVANGGILLVFGGGLWCLGLPPAAAFLLTAQGAAILATYMTTYRRCVQRFAPAMGQRWWLYAVEQVATEDACMTVASLSTVTWWVMLAGLATVPAGWPGT